jgi:Tol biopolymer transport system component
MLSPLGDRLIVAYLAVPAGTGFGPRWSPGGRIIAFVVVKRGPAGPSTRLMLMSARTGAVTRVIQDGVGPYDFSPDGRQLIYRTSPCGLTIARTDGRGAPRPIDIPPPCASIESIAWSPDGSTIAYSSPGGVEGPGRPV